MKRRDFLKFVGMASSASVLASCGVEKGTEKLIPFIVPPEDEDYLPGEAMFRHSACTECPAGCSTTVRIVDFNPIKVDGNQNAPGNKGALCIRGQSSLFRLYNPDRIKTPMRRKKDGLALDLMSGDVFEPVTWDQAYKMITEAMQAANSGGRKNVLLTGRTSGSLSAVADAFSQGTGVERLPEYEPFAYSNVRHAYQTLFGRYDLPHYHIDKSQMLISIGADLLDTFGNPVANMQQITKARKNRQFGWLHFEPHVSLTGLKADERRTIKPGGEAALLAFLLDYIVRNNLSSKELPSDVRQSLPALSMAEASQATGMNADDLNQFAQRFAEAQNPLLVVGGVSTAQQNGLEVATLAGLVQYVSGMTDSLVDFSRGAGYEKVGTLKDISTLVTRLNRKDIGVVFLSETDPMSTLPAKLKFDENLKNAALRVAFSDTMTATAGTCDLILPVSNNHEEWGDIEPRRGQTSFIQPVIGKLYDTRSVGDILISLAAAAGGPTIAASYESFVKSRWASQFGGATPKALTQQGFVESAVAAVNVRVNSSNTRAFLATSRITSGNEGKLLYILPSGRTYDGRSAALKLTREVPDHLTSISHGEWVSVSEHDAEELNLDNENLVVKSRDVVKFAARGSELELPVFVQPVMPAGVATTFFDMADRAMLDMDSRSGELLMQVGNTTMEATGGKKELAILSGGMDQDHRQIIPKPGDHEHEGEFEIDQTLYPEIEYENYRWGMSIDLESCTGCSACVAACYVENNIPITGEDQHIMGREMSWIRIQPYYNEDGTMDSLVMMCQQCGNAPCENVCPVYATYHNPEGLNVMVYNRCVGTRYCHNNCPYKVRRFNYFDWTDEGAWAEPMTRMQNPDVWVRPKGVMEKCTFCLHRIRTGKDTAKDAGRLVLDGEIQTACQQACPTNAIVFGNLKDKNSKVSRLAAADRKFRVLEILGTNPAIHYLNKEENVS